MTFIRDIFLLIARVIVGVVMIAHGWQKYNDWTVEGTGQNFNQMGVPSPELAAQFMTFFEIGGGVLLILGLLVRIVGPILFVAMAGAAWFAHRDSGIFASDGGWELVGVIGAAGLALAAAGAGRISLDHLLAAPFRKRKAEKEAKNSAQRHDDASYNNAAYNDRAHNDREYNDQAFNNAAHNDRAAYTGAGTAGAGTAGTAGTAGAHQQHGGIDAKRDYADERTEQINVGRERNAADNNFDQRNLDPRTNSDQRGFDQRGVDQRNVDQRGENLQDFDQRGVDGDAPTTQWPGNTRKQ